ncbi:unnamed protein product, partial [Brassica oleracea]
SHRNSHLLCDSNHNLRSLLKLRKLTAQALKAQASKAHRSSFESSSLSVSVSVRRNSRLLCDFTELSKYPPLKPINLAALSFSLKSRYPWGSTRRRRSRLIRPRKMGLEATEEQP